MKTPNHITNLKCFPQVAAVIGNANAQLELFKVVHSKETCYDSCNIGLSFIWDKSPQGFGFWCSIAEGINPYDQH